MKDRILLLCCFVISVLQASAQTELWGSTYMGGPGFSTLFRMDGYANGHRIVAHLKDDSNFISGMPNAQNGLTLGANGRFYGLAYGGGVESWGVLFEYDPVTNIYSKKWNFVEGIYPLSSLLLASNGKLYGTCSTGGNLGGGLLFEYDPATGAMIQRYIFDPGVENTPSGNLVEVGGKLYGTLQFSIGGANSRGAIYEYNLATHAYTLKKEFDQQDMGVQPYGGMIVAGNGKLYGTTAMGGIYGQGTLYEYNLALNTITKKFDFDQGGFSGSPVGELTEGNNGKLYGTCGGNGLYIGTLFEYDPVANTMALKVGFDGANKGSAPSGQLYKASNGKLIGQCVGGGAFGMGTMYEYDPATAVFTKLLDFDGVTKGQNPTGYLSKALNGKLYGMTKAANGTAVLFEYDYPAQTFTKKLSFNIKGLGYKPVGTLVQTSPNKLYGVAAEGGANNLGVIFEYDTTTHTYTKKVDFDGAAKGASPAGTFAAANGKLYGLASAGGASGDGALFEYDPATNIFTKKKDLSAATSGAYPVGAMVPAPNNKLYGTTMSGGLNGEGIIFEYDPVTNVFVKKFDFDNSNNYDGFWPMGDLAYASNGNFYGLTQQGGIYGDGVLFAYNYLSNTFTKILDLRDNVTGAMPEGRLVYASNGKLYGTATIGGAFDMGTIFELDPQTNVLTKLVDCDSASVPYPTGNIMQAVNGKIYGLATQGGILDLGLIYEYDIPSNTVTQRLQFDGQNGARPANNSTLLEIFCKPAYVHKPDTVFIVCPGQYFSLQLNSKNTTVYTWLHNGISDPSHTSDSLLFSSISFADTGSWQCSMSNACGASLSQTFRIVIGTTPATITASGPLTFCEGDSVMLTSSQALSYSWSNGDTLQSTVIKTSGSYYVVTTDASNCVDTSLAIVVTVNPAPNVPVITPSGPLSFCQGDSVILTSSAAAFYQWNDGSATQSIVVKISSPFTVTITDANGCSSVSQAVNVTVYQNPAVTLTIPSDTVCNIDPPQTLTGNPAGGAYSGPGVTNNSFDPAAVGPGDYKLLYSFTDVNGCSGKDSVMIHVHICQGVEENAISQYRVFPNPTSGDCRVSGLSKGTVLVVTNLVGEVIYRKQSVSGSETISLENEAAGVYFLQVVSREKTETIRIVKQ